MFSTKGIEPVAKISKTFGINGELTIRLYNNFPDEIDFQEPMFILVNGLLVPFFFSHFAKRGTSKATIIFDDIDSEYRASELLGAEILFHCPKSEPQLDGELYMEDLAGFELIDSRSGENYKIIEYIDSEFNPIFEVEASDGQSYFIPAHDDLIEEIDIQGKRLIIEVPEGVFEINN